MSNMQGKICLVTGATNGIGEVTAHELAKLGATVVIVARNREKGERVLAAIKAETGNSNVELMMADLSKMADVRGLAEQFNAKYDHLHVLVNNAGAMFTNYIETVDGYEMTFGLNHLNYFLLTHLLLEKIKASGTPEQKARIVNVSSDVHRNAKYDRELVQDTRTGYSGLRAYGKSKLYNILFTNELARRLEADGANVTANSLHPGLVATGFGKNNGFFVSLFLNVLQMFGKSAEDGAATQLYLATSPEVEGVTGKYFSDSKQTPATSIAQDADNQQHLWAYTEQILGITVSA